MPGEAAPCPALGSAEAFPVPAAPGGSGLFWEPRGAGKPRCQLSGSPEAGRAEPASVVCRAGRTRRQELGRILEGENYISSSPCSILPGLLRSASALGAGRGGDPALLQEWQPGRAGLSTGARAKGSLLPPGTRWAQRRKTLQGGVSCSHAGRVCHGPHPAAGAWPELGLVFPWILPPSLLVGFCPEPHRWVGVGARTAFTCLL